MGIGSYHEMSFGDMNTAYIITQLAYRHRHRRRGYGRIVIIFEDGLLSIVTVGLCYTR